MLFFVVGAWGQQAPQAAQRTKSNAAITVQAAVSSTNHELTATDLEAFLDGLVPLQIERDDIAGATISVVKDGKLFFAKGYGYADLAAKKPVSPEDTLFRPGSIGKLFTWTAVMQLVENGKINLDANVNDYLDFKIPERFGLPVTMRNLMTHTPGFEERIKQLLANGPEGVDFERWLKTHVPRQIFPPGTVVAYSNYGASLAGYIVQRVSGEPFADYIDRHIFKPLGMTHSTYQQPPAAPLAALMSQGYVLASDGPKPFQFSNPVPAGSTTTSATDMAKFMIAHLQNGEYDGVRILRPETARLMHSRQYGLDPQANGMCLGFYEGSKNGHRIIEHGGDNKYFHSNLHLILDANIGFFVSYNRTGRGDTFPRDALWGKFMDRYFPNVASQEPTLTSAQEDARKVGGTYIISRRSESTMKMLNILTEAVVVPQMDGTIELDGLGPLASNLNGKPKHWREVAPMVFRDVDGQTEWIFKRDPTGRLSIVSSLWPVFILQQTSLPENKQLLLPVAAASLAIMLLTLVLWPVAALIRWQYGQKLTLSLIDRRLRVGVRVVCALDLMFVIAFAGTMAYTVQNLASLNSGLDPWFYFLEVIALAGAVGTPLVFYAAFRSWRTRETELWMKLHETLLAMACLGFVWFVVVGHLVDFNLNY
jgi:CubicO group peptidase (beta-lactamase class C family)